MDVIEASKRGLPWCADCERMDGSFHVVTSDQFAGKVMLCESCLSRRGISIPGKEQDMDEKSKAPEPKEHREAETEVETRHSQAEPGIVGPDKQQEEASKAAKEEADGNDVDSA